MAIVHACAVEMYPSLLLEEGACSTTLKITSFTDGTLSKMRVFAGYFIWF